MEMVLESKLMGVRNGVRMMLLAGGIYLASALGGSYSVRAQAPDPATECAKPNVTCVAPVGNWRLNAQNALDAGNNVYLTDGDLNTEELYQFPGPSTQWLKLYDDNLEVYGEGPNNTTLRRDGFSSIFDLRARGNKIRDLALDNASHFITIAGDNYDNILIDNWTFAKLR